MVRVVGYRDFFVYTVDYLDFCKGFELVQKIVDVAEGDIKGFNFNRHSQFSEGSPNPDPDEHITIRFDVRNDQVIPRIKTKLEEIKNQEKIENWCSEEDNLWDIEPMSRYSPVYHTAHETSTACAFRFYKELKNNSSELQNFKSNKLDYLCMFLPLWLKYSGFTLLNNVSVTATPFIDNLAKKCAESFKDSVDKSRIEDKRIFAKRLFHLFLNCITVDVNQERNILLRMNIQDFNRLGYSLVDV